LGGEFQEGVSADKGAAFSMSKKIVKGVRLETVTELIPRINAREESIQNSKALTVKSCNESVALALEQGEDLVKAKRFCSHGSWADWLKGNCPKISERSARRYMGLAANRPRVADLEDAGSLRAALALCEMEGLGQTKEKDTKRWPPFLEALQRFDKFASYVMVNPVEEWPEEGREKLRELLQTIVEQLWPERFDAAAQAPR
jgi:hypothetical protein